MGTSALLNFRPSANDMQFSYADYAMDGFVKISGRREDEGTVPDISRRSKGD
jgi:hypothetical protein